jgi:hypothetical protein
MKQDTTGANQDAASTSPDRRQRSYRAAAHITREQLRRDAPERARVLDAVKQSDVVVVAGQYDHVESVLEALSVPHTVIEPDEVDRVDLRPEQLLIVNCPGEVSPRAVDRIRAFVEAGGSLFTTDWALKHVVEPAFPGVLAFDKDPTADDVVRIEVRDRDNIYLQGVLDGQDDPQWWLETSSYPISIVDRERVQVLISSRELGEKYGESPVAVWFRWGRGDVFHMISHYYLQRTELRTARHQASASAYFSEKSVVMSEAMCMECSDLSLADVESAKPSAALMSNVIIEKKRRQGASSSGPKMPTRPR